MIWFHTPLIEERSKAIKRERLLQTHENHVNMPIEGEQSELDGLTWDREFDGLFHWGFYLFDWRCGDQSKRRLHQVDIVLPAGRRVI